MSYRLVIAEKPSVGVAYAKVLGATNRQDGYWEGNGYLVSWCMNRYVRRGSKGIALLDESGGYPRLHYVFDVSDTAPRRNALYPDLWQIILVCGKGESIFIAGRIANKTQFLRPNRCVAAERTTEYEL